LPAVDVDASLQRPLDNLGGKDLSWKMTCVTGDWSAAVVDADVDDVSGAAAAGLSVQRELVAADHCHVPALQR